MTAGLTNDRRIAAKLLIRQLRDEGRLDRWVSEATADLPGEESRRVRALVYGVNRQKTFLQVHLAPFLKRPLEHQEAVVHIALLLGSYEMLFQDGVPDRAAVSQAVQLVRERGSAGRTGLVNAILRRLSRKELPPELPDRDQDPQAWSELVASHPRWLVERMAALTSPGEAADWSESNNRLPPLWIRAGHREAELPEGVEESSLVPGAFRLPTASGTRVDQLRGFAQGGWWVQDLAAQAVSALVADAPGQRILDACAAPGGKSFAAAAVVGTEGDVLALDRSDRRLHQLREGRERLGLNQIRVEQHDLLAEPWTGGRFDAVLLDAPCSGLGVVRRHPEVRWTRESGELKRQAARQKTLMNSVAPAVRQGGRLVYSVCSFSVEETDSVVSAFLRDRPDFRMVPASEIAPGLDGSLFAGDVLRTYPHTHDADAFFAAVLERVS